MTEPSGETTANNARVARRRRLIETRRDAEILIKGVPSQWI